jgi:uncharacterized protein (TIGR03437 family)
VAVLAHPDNSQVSTPLTQPIDLGQPGDVVVLVLYATGMRHHNATDTVAVYLGSQRLQVLYAGDQGFYAGLDQVNVIVPASLRGAGRVSLRLAVDGLSSNVVAVNIK